MTGPSLLNSAVTDRRIFPEETAHLCLTATKLIFMPQNKQHLHQTQMNGATELHSVWQERLMAVTHNSSGGFAKIFNITYDLKCPNAPIVKKCPLSPPCKYTP